MLRKLLGAGLLLTTLAGCTKLAGRTCTSDSDCGEQGTCDVSVGLCYAADTEPELDPSACTPACAEYQACTKTGCNPRFTALNILSPAPNALVGSAPVQVSAQLVVNPAYADKTQLPDMLSFGATRSGGGDIGSFGPVTRTGDTYTASWTPPNAQAAFTLTVSHPMAAAVQSAAVNVTVDTVPPTFAITFPAAPPRAQGSTTQADERDPAPGYDVAFRRDESVTVAISADEPVNTVKLTVTGIGPGGTPGQAQAPVTVQPGSGCDGGPVFCGHVTVDLSTLDMRDVRGTADFRVEGQDGAGNHASANSGLKVTRWRWAFESAGAIKGAPAVGGKGAVYFGTSETNGKLFSLNPNGSLNWDLALGQIAGSPAVGTARSGNEEYVYVAAKASGSGGGTFLYALKGSDKSQVAKCPGTGSFGASLVESAIAVGSTATDLGAGLVNVETAVGIVNSAQSRIVGIRPDTLPVDPCISATNTNPATPPTIPGASLVMKGEDVFYGANAAAGARLTSYTVGSNLPRTNWPVITDYVPWGLALLGDKVYGGQASTTNPAMGNLFSTPQSAASAGSNVSPLYPSSGSARVFGPSIGNSNWIYFGTETVSSADLVRLSIDSPSMAQNAVGSTPIRAAPVLGKNDLVYTVASDGKVAAWGANGLGQIWSESLPGVSNLDVSPVLDCRRDAAGSPVPQSSVGWLYVAAGTSVYSLIVDSPGLDPSAPWPKFQHDARNTGNPDTPITNCP